MANIALTAAQIGVVDPGKALIKDYLAASTITKGQVVAMTTAGVVAPADASAGGAYLFEQVKGIALQAAAAGQVCPVLMDGECYGFTVSGLNCGALLYLSDTTGAMEDAGGTKTFILGRVTCLTDKSATKVARIQIIESQAVPT